MNHSNSQDFYLYQKCKQRLTRRIFLMFLFLILYCVGVYLGFNTAFLQVDSNGFTILLATILLLQLGIYSILFLLLASGSKIYRFFFWIVFVFSLTIFYVPVSTLIEDTSHIISYVILLFCMIVKMYVLYHFGLYLYRDPNSKVVFDHTIEVDEYGEYADKRFAKDLEKAQKKLNQKPAVLPNALNDLDEEIPIEEIESDGDSEIAVPSDPYAEMTYQKLSIRLGTIIYSSLCIFPIIVQVFHSLFASNDYEHIFANRDMFIACMVSAIVWSLSVLFLYYRHPKSKKVVLISFGIEIARVLIYAPTFIGHFRAEDVTYPLRTFVFFIILDLIRYIFLWTAIKPIFHMATPEPIPETDDNDLD